MTPERQRTINEMTSVDEPISVVAYDLEWPAAFAREAARLGAALGGTVQAIEHIGSTAVPGWPPSRSWT
jgi:GrpB-like predicted nucleotidyltransferase (UPF0157 family)